MYVNARSSVFRGVIAERRTREELMRTDDAHPIANLAAPGGVDDLLLGRMRILGLDVDAINRDFREVFETIRKNCSLCSDRGPCAVDLRHDPNALIWEAYCPNSEVLNVLVALNEVGR